jgi:integrase
LPNGSSLPGRGGGPWLAAWTGLRPEEWAALERRDVDRAAGLVAVRRTVSDGVVVELAKTSALRRQVPLAQPALAALDELPAQLKTLLLFPSPSGGLISLDNFRRREWGPGPSRPPVFASLREFTICARRSPRVRSPPA